MDEVGRLAYFVVYIRLLFGFYGTFGHDVGCDGRESCGSFVDELGGFRDVAGCDGCVYFLPFECCVFDRLDEFFVLDEFYYFFVTENSTFNDGWRVEQFEQDNFVSTVWVVCGCRLNRVVNFKNSDFVKI